MRSGGVLKLTVTACAALAAAIAVGAALAGHLSLGIGVGAGLLLGSLNGYVLQALLGRGTGELRLPLCPPDAHGREALRRSLDRHGLRVRDDRPSDNRRTRSHDLPALETRDEP